MYNGHRGEGRGGVVEKGLACHLKISGSKFVSLSMGMIKMVNKSIVIMCGKSPQPGYRKKAITQQKYVVKKSKNTVL